MKRWVALFLTLAALTALLPSAAAVGPARGEGSREAASPTTATPANEDGDPEDGGGPEQDPPAPEGFTDVAGHWAEQEIRTACALGLMNGMSPTEFRPNQPMTRGMFVTVLYRLYQVLGGQPQPAEATGFTDLIPGAYYCDAVGWAAAQGIVQGTGPGRFSPEAYCTREQAVTLLYRFAVWLGRDCSAAQYLGAYADATAVTLYARRAMSWAVAVGLIAGTGSNQLTPRWAMTRAQFAALSVRTVRLTEGTLPAPEPVAMPQLKAQFMVVWIDGQRLGSAISNGTYYVQMNELTAKCGGTVGTTDGATGTSTVACSVFGHSLRLVDRWQDVNVDGKLIYWYFPPIFDGGSWYVPLEKLNEILGFHKLSDPDWNEVFYTRIVQNSALPRGCRVPVLMYHAVGDVFNGSAELYVSPSDMEAQLKALLNAGYTPITFEDLDRVDQIRKPVMLTFDDGYRNNYTNLFPLLKKFNVRATIFVIGNTVDASNYLSAAQMREMQASGLVSFQSHTMSHSFLDTLSASQLDSEMSRSRLTIARITGKEPFVLCYPSGRANALAKQYAAQYYQFGLHMTGSCFVTGVTQPFGIYRYYISRYTSLSTFLAYLSG